MKKIKTVKNANFWYRMWSIRIMILSSIITGATTGWAAFQDTVSPITFMLVSVLLSVLSLIGVFARIYKQKDIPNE